MNLSKFNFKLNSELVILDTLVDRVHFILNTILRQGSKHLMLVLKSFALEQI